MPPKKMRSILLMIANVGSTSLEQNSIEDEPFLDKAKYSMQLVLEKKLYLQPKDEIGLITMGDETLNEEGIDNVKVFCDHLSIPNWEMIKYVKNLTDKPYTCNWVEALHVAICYLKKEILDASRIFLVIFNNFKEKSKAICDFAPDAIMSCLKQIQNLHLLFVGENPLQDESYQENFASPSEKFAISFIQRGAAQYEKIDDFIEARRFYLAPPTNPIAWKFNLEIAGLMMPCASYVKINDAVKPDPWKMKTVDHSQRTLDDSKVDLANLGNNTSRVVKENFQLDHQRNEMNADQIINGYKYGGKYIPFSDEDEIAMKFGDTEKGMMIYGFVPQDEVKLEYWGGSGSRIIIPASEESSVAFYSLHRAMVDKNYVAIVRKVYLDNQLPKMGVLFPKAELENIWCFIHIELPFSNEVRDIDKRPIAELPKFIDDEKLEAIDNFIDAMTDKEWEITYLNPGMYPHIEHQYLWNACTERVLHPEKPLLPLNDYLKKYLVPPESLLTKVKPYAEKLDKLFGSSEAHKVSDKQSTSTEKRTESIFEKKGVQTSTIKEKEPSQNVDIDVTNKQNLDTDEGFFSPEDMDLASDELSNI